MGITQEELQRLLGQPTVGTQLKKKEAGKQAVKESSVQDVFASAAKSIIGEDGVNFLGEFGRGGAFDYTNTIVGKGLKSGVAGLVSLPRELPALAEMGYEYVSGQDVDFTNPVSDFFPSYEEAATKLDAKLPEDATEAEKLLYYGMESLPMLGGGGLFRTAARTAQGALAGRVGEENAVLGMVAGAAPEVRAATAGRVPGAKLIPAVPGSGRGQGAVTRVDAIDSDAQRMAKQMANEFGITETRGQAMYRAALAETNPAKRIEKLAEAERVLALEEAGRLYSPETERGVRTNTALWREADIKQAQQIEEAMRKMAGVPSGSKKASEVKDRIVSLYKGWSKKRMEDFTKANAADFGKIDPSIKFDMQDVVDDIDALMVEFDLNTRLKADSQNTLLKIREKILTEKGEIREVNAREIQAVMADLGAIAWKGTIAGFDDLNPGVAKTVARRMMKIFDKSLDRIAKGSEELSAEQVKNLQTARNNFKARITALKDDSSGVLLEFFNIEPEYATPQAMLEAFDAIKGDPRQVKIMSSIVQEENPALWAEMKQVMFNQMMEGLKDPKTGYVDLQKLRQASTKMMENEMLFGDTSATQGFSQLQRFIDSLEGVFQRIDPVDVADISGGNAYRLAKLGSEVVGSAAGPKGRYVSEAATKLMLMMKSGKIPPEAAAFIATNPKSQTVLTKILKGKANALSPKEMRLLRTMVGLGRIQTLATLPAIYFARDENDSAKKAEEFIQSMYQEAIQGTAQ